MRWQVNQNDGTPRVQTPSTYQSQINRSAPVEMAFADLGSYRSVPMRYDNLIRSQFNCGQVGLRHMMLEEY